MLQVEQLKKAVSGIGDSQKGKVYIPVKDDATDK